MVMILGQVDDPDAGLWTMGQVPDFFDLVVDRNDYVTTYPIERTFSLPCNRVAFQPGRSGDSMLFDTTCQQIFLIRNGNLRLIAGKNGVCGHRMGAGSQALLGMGRLQFNNVQAGVNGSGEWYVSCGRTGHVVKLAEQGDTSWNVSAFYSTFSDALTVDASGNVWVTEGTTLYKVNSSGTLVATYTIPANNIDQLAALPDGTFLMCTRNNAYDVIWRFDPAGNSGAGSSTRIAGMTDAEVDAYEQAHGGTHLVDGAAIGEATLHTVQMSYWNSDASEMWVGGGGDTPQLRRVKDGRVSTLFPDGTWQETQILIGSDTGGDLSKPYFIYGASWRQSDAVPYPWNAPPTFSPFGAKKAVKRVQLVNGPGGITNAAFVSKSIPATMTAGSTQQVTVVVHNTGDTTWFAAQGYRLGTQGPQDWGGWSLPINNNRVGLNNDVLPDTDYTFTFNVTAPLATGVYNMQFQMVQDNVAWFGPMTTPFDVTVTGMANPVIVSVGLKLT